MLLVSAQAIAQPFPAPQPPAPEPIVPDAEFDKAVPRFPDKDPELEAPLESIEEFERRLASEAAATAAPPPAGTPAAPQATPPVPDPELTAPLPPLEQFQVEPVEIPDSPASKPPETFAYKVQVNGLDSADSQTATNLADRFSDLSALRSEGARANSTALVAARLREDRDLLQRLLSSEGWYDAEVKSRIDIPRDEDKNSSSGITAVLDVVPGKRYVYSDIVIAAAPTEPPGLIRNSVAIEKGEPIVAARVLAAEAEAAVALAQNGYPFAEVRERDILLDRATGAGLYTLPVETGPRSRFGDFATQGKLAVGTGHLATIARFKPGELYDSRQVDDLREALVATGLFASVAVEPKRSGVKGADGTELVTMMVSQEAGPPRTIAATLGYGAGEGFRAEASWTHRNLFPPEGALIVHGVAGTDEQGAGVTFRRSNAGMRDRTFELALEASHRNYEAYDAYTGRLGVRISRDSTPLWQKKHTWALGAELLGTAEEDYDFDLGRRDRRTYFIAGLSGQYGLDFTDSLLDPQKGFRLVALVQPEGSLAGGFSPYVRARLDASGYFPVSKRVVIAGRARVGTILGSELDEIAPSRRLYAGGGGSVRGFGYQELGQLDPDGKPNGGRSVAEGAIEARVRFGDFGVVGFVDVGQSWDSSLPRFSDLRAGVGIGGRYYTNFGPVRLDIATPIARRPGEAKITVYASIGQAF
ncbi:autotransporter assembly complex family protein [Novosphingobium sp. TH158]|uniref:autotransporter assembly complex protein TamA n=1 Tax=Novosphingobium sp. TH158 TaxID=2067455 RepID=UPI0020B15EF5|nr:BamA/TamA family outer membrane protein [Novosphingobium sp. TH158]